MLRLLQHDAPIIMIAPDMGTGCRFGGTFFLSLTLDGDEDERMTMRDYVCSCLGEAMRVHEEMKDIGLKARIAKAVEANHKIIKKELEKKDVLRR
ncbi:hypothetical protein Tco_0453702 [Tanacetum coccineum]